MYLFLLFVFYINAIIQIVIGQPPKQLQDKADENGWIHEPPITYNENMTEKKKSKSKKHHKKEPTYTITEVKYKGENLYQCNGQLFKTLKDANKCLQKLKKKHSTPVRTTSKFTTKRNQLDRRHGNRGNKNDKQNTHSNQNNKIPVPNIKLPNDNKKVNEVYPKNPHRPNHSHIKTTRHIPTPNPPLKRPPFTDRYKKFLIKSYLSKSTFSNKIYYKIWHDCDYTCYWKDNYKPYKKRALANINLLRESHGTRYLKENYVLDNLAQQHADKMARGKTLLKFYSTIYGTTIGVIYYPAGSLIVTKWYDERYHYKFGSNGPSSGTQMLTQMLWGESKYVGIGVAKNGDYLYLACFYYPRGNINGQYKRNVCKRKNEFCLGK